MLHPVYELLLEHSKSGELIEEVVIGLTWTLCQAEGNIGLAMSPGFPTRTLPWPGTLVGKNTVELARWITSWEPFQATVAMAAINAAINRNNSLLINAQAIQQSSVPANLGVFEWFKPLLLKANNIIVIGRYPGLERYASELNMTVLERIPGAGDLPDPACEYLLPEADWVFLTASSLPNKTFPRLAELAKFAKLVLMGPTVPWLPELVTFGVNYLAGIRIINSALLRQTIAEGGGVKIFENSAEYCIAQLSS